MTVSTVSGLELRGQTYYLRIRVPAEFADVETRSEINRSLKTRDQREAEVRCVQAKAALHAEWAARQAGQSADIRTVFEASSDLLRSWGMTFAPMEQIIEGPIEDLLSRIEAIAAHAAQSTEVSAALGAVDLPDYSLDEMARRMPNLKKEEISAKNGRQLREWKGNYTRAAREFTSVIGKRTVLTITDQDAVDYEAFWKKRVRTGEVKSNYATKQLRYIRQMIDAHFEDIRLPRSKRVNPMIGARVATTAYEKADDERKKLPLPEKWIRDQLIQGRILAGYCEQASDIAIIAAVTGCRLAEIYDLPASDIHLDHEVPHILLQAAQDGPDRRQLKTGSSKRPVVLLGPALEAMRRNPQGFSRYRGNANFSGVVNKYLRDNDLFPQPPEGADRGYVLSGIRHSFEDRMIAAKIGNEERAFLMGHSIGKVRGRPVYGSGLDLASRALLQEMVAFATPTWSPRSVAELWSEIDKLLEENKHRLG
ncbi:DUF6538 domain-containing protein [Pseudooceanicola nitratireducens]|uniref:DUF6538 domain-containing protein n=1 Tax=Pseudooceanicola nitratireducens TaxID=517719 RepID=UPI001C953AD7|nr:DUF6538 domain-containing protein [Pseudooceanicola nitratireducens]MBY6157460.1 hypothetical protein [Pseudooceanicola nitratireducens]